MDFAKFLDLLFFPSNVVLFVFLVFAYNSFALMTIPDILIYSLAVIGFPIGFVIMNRRARRKNRAGLISIIIVLIVFSLLSLIFESLRSLKFLYLSIYAYLTLGLIVFAIRYKWKISLHVSIFTASATILTIFNNNFYPLYFLAPLIAWSRIKLKVHTPYQTLAGFLVGFIVPFILLL
jgi:membrane-associated phospholipid phosphatase